MNTSTIANSSLSKSFRNVYQYSLSLIDSEGNVEHLQPSFTSVPSDSDWSNWLSGWFSIGYSFLSQPVLVKAI